VPASASVKAILDRGAKELGVPATALAKAPAGEALKLKPVRIGLVDVYGGNMPSGWTRWLFEQYEFPFEVIYPKTLDEGNLRAKFDVIVLPDGVARFAAVGRGRGGGGQPEPDSIPEEFRGWLGRITAERTVPQLKKFAETGGSIVTIGSSSSMAEPLGIPATNALIENGRPLPGEKFYIPGSLLKVKIDNSNPLAYGMPDHADMVFDNSPVFKITPGAAKTATVASFGEHPLDSGWAWGDQYLNGTAAVVESSVGEGKVVMFGPEVAFRGQSHGTFKFLFNSMYYGSARETEIK